MTKNSTKKIPRLRFKGFEGEWEEKKLGDVSLVFDGVHQTPKYKNNGIPFMSVENLKTLSTQKYISKDAFENDFKNNKPQKGDILMSRIGSIGEDNIIKDDSPVAFYVSLASIRPQKRTVSSFYLLYLIRSPKFQNELWRRTLHVAFPKKINKNEISKIKATFPNLNEQQKIGSFFAKLDQLINLQSKKVEQLKKLKRGYLQKMFPQKGESIPRLRFDGFSGEWERHILKDVISKIIDNRGKTPSHSSSGKYPIIEVNCLGNFQINYENISKYVNDFTYHNFFRSYLTKNDILFSTVGKTGIVSIMGDDKNAVIAQNIIGMRFKSNFYDPFVYYMFNQLDNFHKAKRIEMGAVQPSIKVSQLVKLSYLFPNLLEQKRIFFILNNIDRLINYENLKIKELIKLKKSYLQKMFC
ncbi:restriction endonuclease subunit S [Apilactobacillus micheneri]|uniref:Restriction endonuclease subunit S n=1 Tax=Apilactobacillus micheneri TaxID=1899430 RepID=A0A9Q8MUE5_9LACO|nr:restriction endonuclease subunit S [Apilactobacillus micheneri]TPR41149.1 restriction endonuclease subunit S [Apilactobacillus micheneri]TPR42730.1 restriction endonuclease subunit S [Apilactobacillus micheneri]TPR45697.1 restriction endonuclease subunit S [Apilactobacillus micheneri]TPR46256.1 restriction endonuclease subunit S [Apilactobacillus micheneri]TPR46941.1 restriction endonuclease subunit S [Apilactobacillus micheneri]